MVAVAVLEAAGDGDLAALKRFRDQSVSENIIDNLGCNCLHYAARKGGADVLGYLVNEKGFHGNRRSNIGATAAHDAAAAGNLEALQWLLKHGGCNINDQDGAGATVLHLACRFGHTRVTEWLLDIAKADSSMRTASNGLPLHFAVVGGDYDAVKLLVDDDPSSVNYQLSNGATATYLAAQEGHIEILRLLIQESRGNVKLKAYDGMSCVHAAAQSGHLNCVRFLVEEEKCNPNDRDFDGATPLHFAASQGHTLIIDWLMRVGGARVMLDNLGGSPLHNAAECDQQESAKVLISHGCSIEITDNNGLTAAELARKCHNESCAHLIETFQPQSQLLLDEDVAYLQSVQSPRQPPGGHTQQPVARQQQTSSFGGPVHLTNNTRNQVHLLNGNHGSSNGYLERNTQGLGHSPVRSRSPFSGKERPRSPVEIVLPLTDKHQERPGTPGSVSARADSDEFPVGVPRNFSQDWSTNENFSGSPVGSSSSLSSLSHLDDAIAVATQEVEKIKSTQTAPGNRKLDSHPVLSGQQEKKIFQIKSYNSNVKNNAGKDAFLATGQKMTKNVKFQHQNEDVYGDAISTRYVTRIEAHGKEPLKKDLHATSNLAKPVMMQSQEMDHKGSNLNENGLNNGSVGVEVKVTTSTAQTALHPVRSHVANLEILKDNNPALANGDGPVPHPHSISKETDQIEKNNLNYKNLVNVSVPPPPPVSTIPKSKPSSVLNTQQNVSVFVAPQILGYGKDNSDNFETKASHTTLASTHAAPPAPSVTGNQNHGLVSKSFNHATLLAPETENQTTVIGTPPAPPPPPPAPPVPGNQQFKKEGNQSDSKEKLTGSVSDDIKRKSASLPARPALLFTAEMMMAQRNTLTPAQTRTAIENSADTDFIQELKMATKGPGLRKTSKNGDSVSKPVMTFSAGHKTVPKDNQTNDKEVKVELTGEWDPKNFVDQVPNKADLPAWKVQLQAKHIAEKAMKEAQEKRKVEENESRFKNMPAWKRALVEKKEAEAKAEEEKRALELEQQQKLKAANKRIPAVAVTSKPGPEGKLSPWQQELQHR